VITERDVVGQTAVDTTDDAVFEGELARATEGEGLSFSDDVNRRRRWRARIVGIFAHRGEDGAAALRGGGYPFADGVVEAVHDPPRIGVRRLGTHRHLDCIISPRKLP
jgi:hypothetical protein